MKRILLSLVTLAIVGFAVTGATTAIFSDEEVSTGNTFTAGAIDLTIDNESYYNGVLNEGTSWLQANLDDGNGPADGSYLFFNFDDLKPGDWGEDTISIHVDNNESWVCADVTLTSNDDNGSTEPEEEDGDTTFGDGEGELADSVTFIWWADDGDNVLEDDETVINTGTMGQLGVGNTATVPLADSNTNIWGDLGGLPGDEVRYVGKAWCFGDMTVSPEAQDGEVDVLDPTTAQGFSCSGAPVNNVTQTDSMTADIAFRAVQSRNNGEFICEPPQTRTTLTVNKVVDNTDGGSAVAGDFNLYIDASPVTNGIAEDVTPDTLLTVTEDNLAGYVATFSGDCNASGEVTVSEFSSATCTITNTFVPAGADITVNKVVSGGSLTAADFSYFVDAEPVEDGVAEFFAEGAHTVSETDDSGLYTATFTGGDCDANGDLTLTDGVDATCEITNTYDPADITIDKIVQFSNETLAVNISDFDLFVNDGVNGDIQLSDEVTMNDLPAGTYTVSEVYTGGLNITVDAQFTGDCSDNGSTGTIVVANGGSASCTLTNVVSNGNT